MSICPICGAYMEVESCWHCLGAGGFYDCGEDCCCCLYKEEITDWCDVCDGEGEYMVCSALPHTDEQLSAYHQRKEAK